MKLQNGLASLQALLEAPSLTLRELSLACGVTRNTSESAVKFLIDHHLAIEHKAHQGTHRGPGRPARAYSFNATAASLLAVDLSPTQLRIMSADILGETRHTQTYTLPRYTSYAACIDEIRDLINRFSNEDRIHSDIWCVGVAATGIVGADGETRRSTLWPDLEGRNLAQDLALGVPTIVGNDARLAALGELERGAARGHQNAIVVNGVPHVSAGVIIAGELFTGHHGAAGEMGELKASGWQKAKDLMLTLHDSQSSPTRPPSNLATLGAKDTYRLAKYLTNGIAALALATDPECIVITGPLGHSKNGLELMLRERLNACTAIDIPVKLSTLGNDAVIIGAKTVAQRFVHEQLLNQASSFWQSRLDNTPTSSQTT